MNKYTIRGGAWNFVQAYARWIFRFKSRPDRTFNDMSFRVVQELAPKHHIIRGGSWDDDARLCRSAFRLRLVPNDRRDDLGFRIVKDAHNG